MNLVVTPNEDEEADECEYAITYDQTTSEIVFDIDGEFFPTTSPNGTEPSHQGHHI